MHPIAPPTPASPTPASSTPASRTPARPPLGGALRLSIAAVVAALLAVAPFVSSAGTDAAITVVFDADDMGFNATSSKDISNIYVEDCDGLLHKHDDLTGHSFVHNESFVIAAVYVKSGNNGIEGNDPPGAGQRFENAGACDGGSSSTTSTTASTTTTTADSSTTTADSSTTTADSSTTTAETSSTTDDNSTEVPFFTSGTALVLGVGGAVVGSLFMLRRRL